MPRGLAGIPPILFLAIWAFSSLATPARTILVTSPADAGPGTLRQAVADALPGDSIAFSAEIARVQLSGGEMILDKDLAIRGPLVDSPEDQVVIDAGGTSRLFHVTRPVGGTLPVVELDNLALTGGAVAEGNGGALYNEGRITLQRCSIHGNAASAGPGGGGNGGGIYNTGILRVEASTLYENKALAAPGQGDTGNGGGIFNGWGGADTLVPRVILVNCTVSGNEAALTSGGTSWSMVLPRAVWALAQRSGLGGGLFNDTRPTGGTWGVEAIPGLMEVEHCTVAFNTASTGGGVANYLLMERETSGPNEAFGGSAFFRGCIVSGNFASDEGGAPDLLGDALAQDSVVGTIVGNLGGSRNATGQNAGLLPLADNGGATLTHALQPWSPAVNAVSRASDISCDQTGAPRTAAGRADSGAWEYPITPMLLGRGAAAVFQDRNGEPVRVALTGPGDGYVTAMAGADAVDIILTGTTGATDLDIETSGQTTVRSILVQGRLKALRAPNADLLTELTVTGGLKKLVLRDLLGPVEIQLGGVPGTGSSIAFRNVRDCVLRSEGKIRKITAETWEGTGDGAHDLVQASKIGKLSIAGWARKLRIVSEGDIEEVTVGGLDRSYVLAGATPGLIGIADPRSDLAARAKLTSFIVTGAVSDANGDQFVDGIIAAWTIGKAILGSVKGLDQGPTFGLSAHSIRLLQYKLGGQLILLHNLKTFADSVREGQLAVSLDSTEDLGFTFGVLDDSRGDLLLPGVATQTLGFLFKHAAEDHCRFLLVPGDLAAGYMGLCMSDFTCALFDPDGSISKALSDRQYPEFLRLAATYGYSPVGSVGQNPTLYPTRGNHECYLKGDLTRDQWTTYMGQYLPQNGPSLGTGPDQNPEMDERGFSYSFRYDNTLFLGIDEYAVLEDKDHGIFPPPSTRVPSVFCNGWLAEQFGTFRADGSLDHCFVFGHSPLFTVKMDTSMDATALTAAGRDVFVQEAGSLAEIYFCGHEHFYDHTLIKNTSLPGGEGIDALHQVLVGTGGAEIDRLTEGDCNYSADYIRDPDRQYYHNPEVPSSGDPQPYIGYNLVTVSGPDVAFLWKAWHVNNPCYFSALPIPCTLCPWCSVDDSPVVRNAWNYSVQRGGTNPRAAAGPTSPAGTRP